MSAHTKAIGHPLINECHIAQQQAVLLNAANAPFNNLLAPLGVNHFV